MACGFQPFSFEMARFVCNLDLGCYLVFNIESHVDADFAGAWDKQEAGTDIDTARSRNGYIIRYTGCPISYGSHNFRPRSHSALRKLYILVSRMLSVK
jgi:hypothetical protein